LPADRITLAAVAGAHGVGGEVRLKLFAQGIESVKQHKAVEIGGKSFAVASIREGGQGAIVRLEGVSSRDAAESFCGQLVTVARSALPPLDEGEYYHADVIGLDCVSLDGEPIGTIVAIDNYGAGDVIEIERPNGRRILLPFGLPAADLRGDRVLIDPVFLV